MRILVTGAQGQLGRCLQDALAESAHDWRALGRSALDIADSASVARAIEGFAPDVVINAAAYTAVDRAETEVDAACRINAEGPAHLARACQTHGARLIHVSTDYVFDGDAERPYREEDTTRPLGVYGASKLAGERAVAEACTQHLIVRVAWVFSEYGNNFLKTMLRLGAERDSLGIVDDQQGTPTYAGDLARALVRLTEVNKGWGTYHFSGGRPVSWYRFAEAIFQEAARQGKLERVPTLNPITTEEFPTPAARPAWSVLDGSQLQSVFGIGQGDWEQALAKVIARL
ncbi:dTDP-4-dehydrorhamnose reductase [Motiliproteus sp. SC1-56]|uniref:dTDP-4-dehydrorhamnose reductase n=1 Tax=Motiliproteus sp. SC1-56 TaxID=2799565 RepID=UPI001A8F87BF|nr:dTDP-4-dehydrorhamnose reductase [Motiliproteus sp. SC1-56]